MKRMLMAVLCLSLASMLWSQATVALFPAPQSCNVNPDTPLRLTFSSDVQLGQRGCICVYDKQTGRLVDKLDMSLPAGPTERAVELPDADYIREPYIYESRNITNRNTRAGTPSAYNSPTDDRYQLTIIGGFSDGFHFYPVLMRGREAIITLHHNLLDYGREYYVTIDRDVFIGFDGIRGKREWTFTTKAAPPDKEQRILTVAGDGSGDFSTLQGAMDFIPDFLTDESQRRTVKVCSGDYMELVYFRNKNYVTIEGEGRETTLVHYPNNEIFNPHPAEIKTNELKGTFPSRRAAVAADNCRHMVFRNITFRTDCKGQAEGFLLNGDHNFAENVGVIGSGDALQVNGSTYWLNCYIEGDGDTVLGRGPSFFNRCTLVSAHAFMWIRNTEENHGNVFISCTFRGTSDNAFLAKTSSNNKKGYPFQEAVLINCILDRIPAAGWSHENPMLKTAHLWEFNSLDMEGNPINVSQRNPYSRQLDPLTDADVIGRYSDARYVLDW